MRLAFWSPGSTRSITPCAISRRHEPLLLASGVRRGDVVLHLAGARGLLELEPARQAGAAIGALHPLAAIATLDPPGSLSGAAFMVEGDPLAVDAARDIAEGHVQITVGTHALIQKDVEFRDLGLAVVAEGGAAAVTGLVLVLRPGVGDDHDDRDDEDASSAAPARGPQVQARVAPSRATLEVTW